MARGQSTKLLVALPDSYASNYLDKLDKRTKVARAILGRIGELESDAGGVDTLAHARRSLIRRAAFIEVLIEGQELGLVMGKPIDAGALTQLLNSLLGVYRLLGLERKGRRIPALRDYLNGKAHPVEPAL